MSEMKDGCVTPARGPIMDTEEKQEVPEKGNIVQEKTTMKARVGKEAPDFEANAFVKGEGFKPVKLSDYQGEWIVVCFYPGDFTFV